MIHLNFIGGVLKIRQSHVFFSGSEDNFKRPTNISRAFSQPSHAQVSRRCDPSCDRKSRCCDTEKMARAATQFVADLYPA